MAVDMMQMFIDVLRISPNVLNEYSRMPVLEQVFYLLFFPILFLIIFIYILTSIWMSEHKGLRILVGVAVCAFIILQGMYEWFIILSKYWFFGLIALGAFWFITGKRNRGASGGGGAQGFTSKGKKGGLFSDIQKRLKGQITGEFKQREQMIMALLDQIEDALKKAGGGIEDVDNIIGGGGGAMMMMSRVYQLIMDLRQDGAIMGFPESRITKLIKRYNVVAHKLGTKTIK
ncbi:MAG: hypothetical protein KAS04_04130 [Candidatus Aenigmarchaeota archaeon]|nr:hypothetical protein [Candidatus Aenigmarchaeota archaeon]